QFIAHRDRLHGRCGNGAHAGSRNDLSAGSTSACLSEGGCATQAQPIPPARLRGECRVQTKSIGSSMGPWQVEPSKHAPAGIAMVNSMFSYLSAEAVRTFACPVIPNDNSKKTDSRPVLRKPSTGPKNIAA